MINFCKNFFLKNSLSSEEEISYLEAINFYKSKIKEIENDEKIADFYLRTQHEINHFILFIYQL